MIGAARMDPSEVSLTDLELVDALQISPRAPWSVIGEAVGLSQATVSRRMTRLLDARLAWTGVAFHPAATKGAFIELTYPERDVEHFMGAAARHPDVFTVGRTTGEFNVYLITVAASLQGILRGLHGGIPELAAAVNVRTSLFRQLTGGVHWSQGILAPAEEKHLKSLGRPQSSEATPPLRIADRPLLLALSRDGRASAATLAPQLGRSPTSVRRRIQSLLDSRQIIFRADVARPLFDLPLSMVVLMKAPPASADTVASALGQWRETRFCAAVIGASNIILIVGLNDLLHAERMLSRLDAEFPDVEVHDRRIVTKMRKIYGHILDEQGRSAQIVPVDPWVRSELPDPSAKDRHTTSGAHPVPTNSTEKWQSVDIAKSGRA